MERWTTMDLNGENEDHGSENIWQAQEFIREIENHGPAGLVHVAALSHATGSPVRIWSSRNELRTIIGHARDEEPVDAQFHRSRSEGIGHWTLRANKEPDIDGDLNDCLFTVVGAQTDRHAKDLRKETIEMLRRNIKPLANCIDQIRWLEENDVFALMIGGAKYSGRSPRDAAYVLDRSQNAHCYGCSVTGHPRGHASHPSATGATDSAENYSRFGEKSAFLSRHHQDNVAHSALTVEKAQRAMQTLNNGSISERVQIRSEELDWLPKGRWHYTDGKVSSEISIKGLILILRHHENEYRNENADVFVHTFYPKLRQ